jgi:hypothetical protein
MKYLVPFKVTFIGHLEVEADNPFEAYNRIEETGPDLVEERLIAHPTAWFDIKFNRRGVTRKE